MDIDVKNQLVSKTARVIMYVEKNPENSLKEISKSLDIDYNFVSKIVQRCEEAGIMKSETVGKKKITTIVKKGKEISTLITKIEALIE